MISDYTVPPERPCESIHQELQLARAGHDRTARNRIETASLQLAPDLGIDQPRGVDTGTTGARQRSNPGDGSSIEAVGGVEHTPDDPTDTKIVARIFQPHLGMDRLFTKPLQR